MAQRPWFKRCLANTWFFPRHIGRKYLRRLVLEARGHVRGIVLDVGCGLRPYEDILGEFATNYIGLDLPVSGEKARQDVTGDATHLPLHDASVDTVLAFELMEHLSDPDLFLTEIARVLRGDGALILSVPFLEPLHEQPRDFYRFTPYGLRVLLERHGFSVKYIKARGYWWSVVLGSFLPQALYALANPLENNGQRRYRTIPTALVLPLCAFFQLVGYVADQTLAQATDYTLGYFAVAFRRL